MDERGERGKQTVVTLVQVHLPLHRMTGVCKQTQDQGKVRLVRVHQVAVLPTKEQDNQLQGVASSSANPSTSVRGQRSTSSNGNASISLRGQMGTSDRNTGPTQRGGGQSRGGRSRHQPQRNEPPEGQVRRQGQLQRLATNPSHMVPSLQHQHAVQRQHGVRVH